MVSTCEKELLIIEIIPKPSERIIYTLKKNNEQ